VISIKKFLTSNTEDQTLLDVILVLIQGIGEHAVAGNLNDIERFRESIKEIALALAGDISPADLLVRAGAVLQCLEDHNSRAIRHQNLQTAELQTIVRMLTYTVGAISASGHANLNRLGEIEKQIAVASELDDIRGIKLKLAGCLADIRKEAQRQRQETGQTLEQLNQSLDQARLHSAGAPQGQPADPINSLPPRAEAEAALAEAGIAGSSAYAAVMALDRLQVLNQRFGEAVADEILVEFTRMVRKQLTPGDRLFRWGPHAFLALLPRPSTIERVRVEIGRIMESKLEHTIEMPSRSVMVPIVARWTLLPMMAAPRLIYQQIDAFISGSAQRDRTRLE